MEQNKQYVKRVTVRKKRENKRKLKFIITIVLLISIIFIVQNSMKIEKKENMLQNNHINSISKLQISNQNKNILTVESATDANKKNKTIKHDYSKPIQSSEKVDLEYFKDAVFVGDSRTEGFILNNSLISNTTSYTSKGLKVDTIFTEKVINKNGKKITIMEALRETSFNKVYIMLGINETGWQYSELFIKKYSEIIDEIRKINPNCSIYVESILPVTKKASDEHKYIKNSKIDEYNLLIQQMAEEKKVYYINAKEAVINDEGVLPEDAATDGIHLNRRYCEKWLDYLTKHVVEKR